MPHKLRSVCASLEIAWHCANGNGNMRNHAGIPALCIGIVTVVAPLFSLGTHTDYGFGLYLTALATASLINAGT